MIRPVFFGLFLRRKPSRTWRTYLVLFPRFGLVSRGGLDAGLAVPDIVGIGLWHSRPSRAVGDRVWIRVRRSAR